MLDMNKIGYYLFMEEQEKKKKEKEKFNVKPKKLLVGDIPTQNEISKIKK